MKTREKKSMTIFDTVETSGRFKIRVKLPHQDRAATIETLNTRRAAMAVLRDFYTHFRNNGFTCRMKPRENYKHHMFRRDAKGEVEVVTLELYYDPTEADFKERFSS